jgi:hypothetical protein
MDKGDESSLPVIRGQYPFYLKPGTGLFLSGSVSGQPNHPVYLLDNCTELPIINGPVTCVT